MRSRLYSNLPAILLACVAVSASLQPVPAAARPNIVLLYADDMGYDDLGAENPESKIPTPHLDPLAAESMSLFR